ncbi:MAG: ribonuclease R [Pseudomonadota bacterium]
MSESSGRNKKGGAYKHPVPDRVGILDALEQAGRPLDFDQIAHLFSLKGKRQKRSLSEVLSRMLRSGQLHLNRQEQYCLSERLEIINGSVRAHRDGFGFLIRDDDEEDMYLSPREMARIMDGDRVATKLKRRTRRGSEAMILDILERAHQEVAGRYISERGIGLVVPDNPRLTQRLLVPRGKHGKAKPGDVVIAKILDYPDRDQLATASIARVLGDPEKHGMPTDLAIHAHGIPHRWPRAVGAEAKQFGATVPTRAKRGRKDLRKLPLVTIDGADARDFDDAVYAKNKGSGWRLIVAIADVAHYVTPDSPIDKEAINRATSVYFPDRVVPMLPEVLSNGLCSLNPRVDRLCMVCDMTIDGKGQVTRSIFYDAVMRSHARLTYSEVKKFLDGERSHKALRGEVAESVRTLHDLYKAFAKRRKMRGAIELDLPQLRIRTDDDGEVRAIAATPRNDAHRLIEECMIAANVEAAKFILKKKVQALFRVHAKPDEDRFDEFRRFMLELGFKVPHSAHPTPKTLRALMSKVQDRPDAYAINMALLRSFAHAEYTPDNIGHFGLALDAYAHFTSPIRRYPDLLVHRAIRHMTSGGKAHQYRYDGEAMVRLGKLTSERERRAEEATREVEALLKCQYMSKHLGERFHGLISGVTHFGLFVQIGDLQVDGLIHVSSLGSDYFKHEPERQRLVGNRSGQVFQLGDMIEVIVNRVDMESRQIDFVLYDRVERTSSRPERKKRRGR